MNIPPRVILFDVKVVAFDVESLLVTLRCLIGLLGDLDIQHSVDIAWKLPRGDLDVQWVQ